MARIRSVHPGLATDARFVVLSDAAQIFYVLLLTVADDAGVFRWEPIELRMQLRPASSAPIEPLLDELLAGNFMRRFEAGGNAYGAVRNFRRYQSPKLPTRRHPLPANLFPYVGLEPGAPEPAPKSTQKKSKPKQYDESRLPQPFPSTTEALPQPFPTERDREREKDRKKASPKELAFLPSEERTRETPPPLPSQGDGVAASRSPTPEPAAAPTVFDDPELKADVIAMLDDCKDAVRGKISIMDCEAGIPPPPDPLVVAFRLRLLRLNVLAGERLTGQDRMQAWQIIADADAIGDPIALPPEMLAALAAIESLGTYAEAAE